MNRHILLFICLFFCGIFFSYAQGIRPPGIYEVGDTTIEVYDLKELNAIREFKIINGTDHILFREFNRLTKKLREEGMFTAGYSSGKWKFYNLLGRVKKEVDYDNQVKTVHNTKLDAAPLNSLAFDYEKYKADSVTAERYWRMKREGTSSNAPVAKKTEQSAMQDSGEMHKGISASGMSPVASTPTTLAAKKDVQKTEEDSARQKTENSLFKKLWSSKKESAPSKNKSGYVPPGTDSATVKKEVEKNETAANAVVKAPPAKKGSRKGTSGYVPPSATEEKKPLAKETTEEPVNVISKRPTEHSEKSAEDKQPEERKNETVKNSSKKETAPENKPVEQKKETAKEAKQEADKKSEVVKNTTKPAEKESITAIKPAEKKKEVLKEVKKQDAQKEEGMKNTSLTDVKTESVAVSKPNEQKKEAPKKEITRDKEATSHIEKEKIRTEETLLKKEEQGAKKESSVNTNKQEAVKKEAMQSAVKKEKTVSDTKTEKSKKEAIKEKPEQSLIKKTEAKKESDRSVTKTADTSASAKQSQAKTKATADQKPKSHVTVADSLNSKKDSLSLKNTINPTNVSDTTAKQKTNKG